MCHDDSVVLIKNEVPGTGQLLETGVDLVDVDSQLFSEVDRFWSAAAPSERAVHGEPQIFEIHPGIVAERDRGPTRE